ncbi:MAG: hypothetical protein ACJ71O_16245 [Nitrososphaeraceae archaeon]
MTSSYKQTLPLYDDPRAAGFSLKELALLRNTFLEIANANNILGDDAGSEFFNDIEEQYDDKLGFESKVNKLRDDASNLLKQKLELFVEINTIPQIGFAFAELLRINETADNIIEEIKLLVDQVHKAGGIRAAINK